MAGYEHELIRLPGPSGSESIAPSPAYARTVSSSVCFTAQAQGDSCGLVQPGREALRSDRTAVVDVATASLLSQCRARSGCGRFQHDHEWRKLIVVTAFQVERLKHCRQATVAVLRLLFEEVERYHALVAKLGGQGGLISVYVRSDRQRVALLRQDGSSLEERRSEQGSPSSRFDRRKARSRQPSARSSEATVVHRFVIQGRGVRPRTGRSHH